MKMKTTALCVLCFLIGCAGSVLADSYGLAGMMEEAGGAAAKQAVDEKADEAQGAADTIEGSLEQDKGAASDAAKSAETAPTADWSENALVSALVKDTGVKPEQAAGGAGSIFQFAKSKMSGSDFGQVAGVVPNMTGLLGAAPSGGSGGGLAGAASSALGGGGGTLGAVAALAGPFSQLGLSSDMIGQFIPVILSFVQSQGGSSVSNLLSGVLQP